jgi:hypothetical protein
LANNSRAKQEKVAGKNYLSRSQKGFAVCGKGLKMPFIGIQGCFPGRADL